MRMTYLEILQVSLGSEMLKEVVAFTLAILIFSG